MRPQLDPLGAVLQILTWLRMAVVFLIAWAALWALWCLAAGHPVGPNEELKRCLLSGAAAAVGCFVGALVWYVRGGERR
jgi:hypothetical protein